ncbi:2,3-bisphosphoglycerate-independent phosphoglycerate mutase [Gossypium arboreum]|uniref:2,3-bisphosphoglycerate-independent phosphoglycerate mutase n=1 Tax=Gossypium arboreum TaxID=29729 RepID=A0A0B0MKZ9_GOSAR|nr:2,3-bisphosphoglycerate-independent phosphoglycerate mutase [Gossypium arboreum]
MPTSQTWSYLQSHINATVPDRVLHEPNINANIPNVVLLENTFQKSYVLTYVS